MSDIRMFTNVNGIMLIGEYIDNLSVTGELISSSEGGIISGKKVLRDPAMIQLMPMQDKKTNQQIMMPIVMPMNQISKEIRGGVEDIDIESNNLLELKQIPLEGIKFMTNQYNELASGIDLNIGNSPLM